MIRNTRFIFNATLVFMSMASICHAADTLATSTVIAVDPVAKASHFAIGYDHGISLRFFLSPQTTLSLIGRPTAQSEYGGFGSTTFYNTDVSTTHNQYSSSDYAYTTQNNTTSKGAGVFLQLAYAKDLMVGFSVSPYLEVGGTYGTYTTSSVTQSTYIGQYSYYNNSSSSTIMNSYTATTANLELGVMPGFTYKKFTVQFKLGIGGEMTMKDPEPGKNGDDSKTKRGYFKYPMYDLINSFSIHLAVL